MGFYVRDDISFKKIENLSTFIPETFECLTIEAELSGHRILLSSLYRSPSTPPMTSLTEHQNSFINHLDSFLHKLSSQNKDSYIFTDSNINLLQAPTNFSQNYIDVIHSNGFIQCIQKATRIQNQSSSLIDHIISNSKTHHQLSTNVIKADISDHFLTSIRLPPKTVKC